MHIEILHSLTEASLPAVVNTLYKLKEQGINRCKIISSIGYVCIGRFIGTTKSSGYDMHINAATYICNFLGLDYSITTQEKEKSITSVKEYKQIRINVPNIEKAIENFKCNQYEQILALGDSGIKQKLQQTGILNSITNAVTDELLKTLASGFGVFEVQVEFDKISIANRKIVSFVDEEYGNLPDYRVRDSLAALILLKIYEVLMSNEKIKKIDEATLTHDSNYDSGMYTQQNGYSICRVQFDFVNKITEEDTLKKWV